MTRIIFAVLLLSLSIAACEPGSTETNSNANSPANTNANGQASPAPAASPSPVASPSATPQLKAGDKVKVTTNGVISDATVVSVDEKTGQVTVRLQGETKEKTVAIRDIVKQ
ncbi:MAG TPA: hypothetical protein VGJ55_14770 [Pyrinomonadaceae bacterium]